jgi:tripartite-type tricarboxylate transporter receptor subunit TctC
VVPSATPEAIIARLNEETKKALDAAPVHELLERQGIEPQHSTAADFGRLMRDDRQRWSRLVKEAGVVLR